MTHLPLPPKYLFHYRGPENLAILREGELRLGNSDRFDDVLDCRIPSGKIDFCTLSQEELQNTIRSFGVVCLSECHNNPDMWRRYGGNHTGFCLGFDVAKLGHDVSRIFYCDKQIPIAMMIRQTGPVIELPLAMKVKKTFWANQKEWRIIKGEPGGKIPYPSDALKAVYLGTNAEPDMVAAIRDIVKTKYSGSNKPGVYRGHLNKKADKVLFARLL